MSSIIVASVLILIIVLIILMLVSINNRHRKKNAIELVNRFNELGERNNLSFTHKELMENFTIGLDEFRKILFVIRRIDGKYDSQVINLRNVKSCSKKKIYRTINIGTLKKERYENHIDKIVLEFDDLDNKAPIQVSFYESGGNHLLEMSDLEAKAASWVNILTKTLNTKIKGTA